MLGTILSKLQRLLALSTPHNSTYNSSLRILTACKHLSAQCLLESSLKTRVNYLCSPLDPKLLEALYAQAPPGPQSFLSGLSLERMKGLYAERRQEKPWEGWSPAHYWLKKSVMQLAPDKTATVDITQGDGSWLVPLTGYSSLSHFLLAPHTEKQKFSQCGCNRDSFLYSATALCHRFISWPNNCPNCRQVM